MKLKEVGVNVEYQNLNGSGEKISGDQFICPNCGANVVARFADRPFAFHFQPDYKRGKADVIVKERA